MSSESYYRARYYDPSAGRFISEDPIAFGGGVNFYAYVRNLPTSRTDPFGLDPAVDYQIAALHALLPGSTPQGASLLVPMSCDDVSKMLNNTAHYYTNTHPLRRAQADDGSWISQNPFLFWDPFAHSGGTEWRTTFGFHFRMKYNSRKCDKTCTLDQFHIDTTNPMFNPGGHLLHDFVPWLLSKFGITSGK